MRLCSKFFFIGVCVYVSMSLDDMLYWIYAHFFSQKCAQVDQPCNRMANSANVQHKRLEKYILSIIHLTWKHTQSSPKKVHNG